MIEDFETMLTGGHPNSLGRAVEVVAAVLDAPARFGELLDTYDSADDVVRFARFQRDQTPGTGQSAAGSGAFDAFLDRVINLPHLGAQPSAQWTVAQVCLAITAHLTADQYDRAKGHMMANLEAMNDWIVLAQTMTTLSAWAKTDDCGLADPPIGKAGQRPAPIGIQAGRKIPEGPILLKRGAADPHPRQRRHRFRAIHRPCGWHA